MLLVLNSYFHSHSSVRCVVTYSPSDDEIKIKFQRDFNIHVSIKIMKALRPNESQQAHKRLTHNSRRSSQSLSLRTQNQKSLGLRARSPVLFSFAFAIADDDDEAVEA